ncbi:GUN4 domain-containing protein [Microcoleus sp. ARI1-B5]|uniref:GUN4 domain-containing protein n=1 Tax=unclassified Microcoleus TaxID=2642155 RepID=UPI002FD0A465
MKILFFAANPEGTAKLRFDKEFSQIEDGLQRSKLRDQFQLVPKLAVDSNSLRRALLEENFDIVHYSGHGGGQKGLLLDSLDGKSKPATAEALCGLFKQFPNIKCVLLNACYTEVQAKAIVQHIDYVIGMKQAMPDDAAIAFATGFYDGLGYGKSIDVAFELGCSAVQCECDRTTRSRKAIPVDFEKVEPLPDYLIPVLFKMETGSTGSLTNPTPASSEANSLSEKLRSKDDINFSDALKIYRGRVQEFLADFNLSTIEKFQLAILANVLGVSEADANRILQEEEQKLQENINPAFGLYLLRNSSESNRKTLPITLTQISKKYIISTPLSILLLAGVGLIFYRKIDYWSIQFYLIHRNWEKADQLTTKKLLKEAGRSDLLRSNPENIKLSDEEIKHISCTALIELNKLWEGYSNEDFGFGKQNSIWKSVNPKWDDHDWNEFMVRVGWKNQSGERNKEWASRKDPNFFRKAKEGQLPSFLYVSNAGIDFGEFFRHVQSCSQI